jgi:hypothetical protein
VKQPRIPGGLSAVSSGMEHNGDGQAEVARRLQALGHLPMDEEMAQRVLARATRRRWSRWRSTKAKVAAGVVGGFAVGSVGLASAGALPAPVQSAAHSALGVVAVNVPSGHARYDGPECGGTYANHGAYVRAHHGGPAAATSGCGKPTAATGPGPSEAAAPPTTTADGAPGGHGPPPWAHAHGKGKGQPGQGHDDSPEGPDDAGDAAPPGTPAPSTTVAQPPEPTPAAPATPTTSTAPAATSTTSTSTSTAPTTTSTAP